MNIKEKQILALQWAKIHVREVLQKMLESKLSDVVVEVIQETLVFKVLLFEAVRRYFDKKLVQREVQKIVKLYCPSFTCRVLYLASTQKQDLQNPKYYFQKVNFAYRKFKTNVFNFVTRLQTLKLPQSVEGLRVVVKGKRGTRKFKKTVINGNVCYHSPKPNVLRSYKGAIQTTLGTMGINVFIKMKTDPTTK